MFSVRSPFTLHWFQGYMRIGRQTQGAGFHWWVSRHRILRKNGKVNLITVSCSQHVVVKLSNLSELTLKIECDVANKRSCGVFNKWNICGDWRQNRSFLPITNVVGGKVMFSLFLSVCPRRVEQVKWVGISPPPPPPQKDQAADQRKDKSGRRPCSTPIPSLAWLGPVV